MLLIYCCNVRYIYVRDIDDMSAIKKKKNEDIYQGIHKNNIEIFRLVSIHLAHTIQGSAYNWVRPSLWTAIFGKLTGFSGSVQNMSGKVSK